MRILLIGLAAASVGISLTVLVVGYVHVPTVAHSGTEQAPNYSLSDIFGIVSEAQTLDDRRERYAVIHQEWEQGVEAVWDNKQSLREAAQHMQELVPTRSPDYHASLQSIHPGVSLDEAYARSLMSLLHHYAANRTNRAAARARYSALIDQFRREFRTGTDLFPLNSLPTESLEETSPDGHDLSRPVDWCP